MNVTPKNILSQKVSSLNQGDTFKYNDQYFLVVMSYDDCSLKTINLTKESVSLFSPDHMVEMVKLNITEV